MLGGVGVGTGDGVGTGGKTGAGRTAHSVVQADVVSGTSSAVLAWRSVGEGRQRKKQGDRIGNPSPRNGLPLHRGGSGEGRGIGACAGVDVCGLYGG